MENGIYITVFVYKDGKEYKIRTIPARELTNILTHSLIDGVEKVLGLPEGKRRVE